MALEAATAVVNLGNALNPICTEIAAMRSDIKRAAELPAKLEVELSRSEGRVRELLTDVPRVPRYDQGGESWRHWRLCEFGRSARSRTRFHRAEWTQNPSEREWASRPARANGLQSSADCSAV